MSIRNVKKEELQRLQYKTLDAQFLEIVEQGLNCSPFEGNAVLDVVKEVYFPFLDESTNMAPPGRVTLVAVDAEEPAGKPIAKCKKKTVCLVVHRGKDDDRTLRESGPPGFRQTRIPEVCQQALSQGALLTREDLAYRVFFTSTRTISRDLAVLRKSQPEIPVPLRSTVHDIGPVLTHRVSIVQLALEGKTTSEICDITRHSPLAVGNYVSTFTRCAQLVERGLEVGQIAFLLHRGRGLIQSYIDLLECSKKDANMEFHLEKLLCLGCSTGKKNKKEGNGHGA